MGVIRNFDQSNRTAIDDDWIYLSSDGEELTQTGANHLVSSNTRRRNQRTKRTTKPEPTFKALGVKGKSHKKFRRYANANLAMTELGNLVTEDELDEISIDDFIPQYTSPFALLLQNLDQTIDLNSFINCTEDEQNDLIDQSQIGQEIKLEIFSFSDEVESDYSKDSEQCFIRIDPKIRKQLIRKHIPLGLLSSIESQIVQFFRDNPDSMYEVKYATSYHRFLLHACCQYLNLNCQSVDFNGQRLSFVKNKKKYFAQPLQLLSEYLEFI